MPSHIPESDWRHFKRVHDELLERYCARVLDELAASLKAGNGTAQDRYVRAYKLLKNRDKDLARAFDDFRRSTAVMQLAIMRSMGLLTDKDLSVFSEQTQAQVRGINSIVDCWCQRRCSEREPADSLRLKSEGPRRLAPVADLNWSLPAFAHRKLQTQS